MTPLEPTATDRRERRLRPSAPGRETRRAGSCVVTLVAGILAGAVGLLPAAAWADDGSAGRAGAGGAMPSFVLQNLLALAMSLTVLVIACKRFRKE